MMHKLLHHPSGISGPTGYHTPGSVHFEDQGACALVPLAVSCIRPLRSRQRPASDAPKSFRGAGMSGFKALMICCTTPWMAALIDRPSGPLVRPTKGVVVRPRRSPSGAFATGNTGFPDMGRLQAPQGRIGRSRSHIYALPSSRFRRNPSGKCAIHLSARPPCGATRCPSHHIGVLGRGGRHTTPI